MLKSIDLRDYMNPTPMTIKPDANLLDAMELIIKHKVSGLCVVDDHHHLVGVLSEMDCLKGVLSATYNESGVGAVSNYMYSENIVTASPQDDIVDVAQDMLLKSHRRRPVIENGKLVGQVTCRRLLAAVKDFPH
ncbi:CBS domain-containing protein [Dasania sp. GY-MA-18]|uniref:CBS domain-containing protein n=1 Tax=Dasania phycosphaerae TaxID=2950436 RepID=A0A9J6RNT2_9GAMM|nr:MULTISPECIES: CBS domain-containing protein [Dasania]MCR8923730.1 CBS domain-containing protein [Dasania sp. GY-MA-18]MCZ0866164.1 CBS domain-containing protein [Dasania phycosphaerae]MCZ0869888.1 CBS domain-containing protein [Dasania phycosphaerae]